MSERTEATQSSSWGSQGDAPTGQQFQTLVNAIDDGLYQLDADGRFVGINDELVELTGYSRDELVDEHVTTVLDSEDATRIEREMRNRLSAGRTDAGTFELAFETAEADRIPVELRVSLLTDDGTYQGTVGVAREISDRGRDQSNQELVSSESIRNVLDEADVGVFILDEEFDVAWIDENVAEYFGLDRDAVIGRDKRELVEETIRDHVADDESFSDAVMATYDDNSYVERFECRVTPEDDREERWLEHRSKPIESGRYAGGRVELYYDVTEQHRHASQLQQLNEAVNEWLSEPSREAVAQQASRHLRDILGMDINAIFLHDAATEELRPTGWTERAETLFGDIPTLSAGESIAWRVFESGDPEIYEDVSEASEVYDPDTPARSEIILPIGDHGVVIIGSEERGVFDDNDLMLAEIAASTLQVTFDKITTQQRLEERKNELETELEGIYGRITDAFYAMDEQWRFTHVNERAEELLDHEAAELVGKNAWEVFDWGIDSKLGEKYRQAMATQEPNSFEFYYPPLETWFQIHAYPSETGLSVHFRDVTERKEREHELAQYETLFEESKDVNIIVDPDGTFQYLTPSAANVFGYDPEELVGEVGFEYIHPDDREKALTEFAKMIETPGYEPRIEFRFEHKDGSWIVVEALARDLRDDPDIEGIVIYTHDVTDRKEYEHKLEESNERLEQFAYAASHDLQEPLRMVSSYLQLIENRYADELDDDAREFIGFAVDGAERMKVMIDGLLEYSRIETRGDPIEPVELDAILDDVRENLQVTIEESDAEITAESLPRVEGDASQLRQVFQNLLSNAIEYSGDEPPRIDVAAERVDDEWIVSVSDEGIGIDPDDADRVFEVFQRLHTRDEHEGSGIGLALCKRIVERHGVRPSSARPGSTGERSESVGGDIWVEAEPGEGSTFSFTLPAAGEQSE